MPLKNKPPGKGTSFSVWCCLGTVAHGSWVGNPTAAAHCGKRESSICCGNVALSNKCHSRQKAVGSAPRTSAFRPQSSWLRTACSARSRFLRLKNALLHARRHGRECGTVIFPCAGSGERLRLLDQSSALELQAKLSVILQEASTQPFKAHPNHRSPPFGEQAKCSNGSSDHFRNNYLQWFVGKMM